MAGNRGIRPQRTSSWREGVNPARREIVGVYRRLCRRLCLNGGARPHEEEEETGLGHVQRDDSTRLCGLFFTENTLPSVQTGEAVVSGLGRRRCRLVLLGSIARWRTRCTAASPPSDERRIISQNIPLPSWSAHGRTAGAACAPLGGRLLRRELPWLGGRCTASSHGRVAVHPAALARRVVPLPSCLSWLQKVFLVRLGGMWSSCFCIYWSDYPQGIEWQPYQLNFNFTSGCIGLLIAAKNKKKLTCRIWREW